MTPGASFLCVCIITWKDVDLASLGAPYLHLWVAMVRALCVVEGPQKEMWVDYWKSTICKQPQERLADTVRFLKTKKIKTFEKVKGKATQGDVKFLRVQFCLGANDEIAKRIQEPLTKGLVDMGGERKHGAAPRGSLIRDAQKIMDDMNKSKR